MDKEKVWTKLEIEAVKFYYPSFDAEEALIEINKVNPKAFRSIGSIANLASRLGLKSRKRTIKDNQISIATELIEKGETDIDSIAKKTKLHKATVSKIKRKIDFDNLNLAKKEAKEKEDNIENWEEYYLTQPTPKGYECPKLNTKQLNTYK